MEYCGVARPSHIAPRSQCGGSIMDPNVAEVVLSEKDLFHLDDIADGLLGTHPAVREYGVFKFTISKGSEAGCTSVHDFLEAFGPDLQENLKRQNPVRLVGTKSVFGHLAFESQHLEPCDVDHAIMMLQNPSSYEVQTESNCCLEALQSGEEALMDHIHSTVSKNASKPPSCYTRPTMKQMKDAASTGKRFDALKARLQNENGCAEKAALLKHAMKVQEQEDESKPVVCLCPICITGDDLLCDDDESTDYEATAKYYDGKGFLYASGINVKRGKLCMMTTNFSLSFLSASTITRLLGSYYPGISTGYLYFGLPHSFASVHIEDLSLWSVNFLHHGHPKVWVIISPLYVQKLHYFLSTLRASGSEVSCRAILSHKYFVLTVKWLKSMGIPLPFKLVIQRQRQGLVVSPNAAHMVFNFGPNIAEAINFASPMWVPYGIVYPKCACMLGQIHADLAPLIAHAAPEMLQSYIQQKIPKPQDHEYFLKTIILPRKWREVFANDNDCTENWSCSEDSDDPGKSMEEPIRKQPKRKCIQCPICNQSIKEGTRKGLRAI